MATQNVLLQLLRVKLLALSVVTHKPLVSVGNVQTAVQPTLTVASCPQYTVRSPLNRMHLET